jgi:hypothetical protein
MKKIILHLCADIGSDSWYYVNHEDYEVIKIGKDIGVENYNPPENVYGIIANPVCTEFSFAKYANNNGIGNHEEGMILVNHCLRIIKQSNPKFWVIENPATGRLKDFLGKPKLVYQPYEYGSPWTKKTALWGNFNIPDKTHNWQSVEKNDKLYTRPNRQKPSLAFLHKSAIHEIPEFHKFKDLVNDDMSLRSLCSQKFAEAFFNYNR